MSKNREDYYNKASTWDQEVIANALISKKRAWIVAFFCMGISILSLFTLILILPLKTFEPYVVTVDRATGYLEVSKGLSDLTLSEDEAVTEANLVKYVSLREQYNPAILKENYETVEIMSDGQALKEYQELWAASNSNNPSIKLGRKTSIDIKIKSVSFINDKTASIRFLREVRENDRLKISHWNAVIQFRYSQKPMQMKDRFSNPLGFQVTTYRVNPEVLETIR
ncbi:MAG: type IV secretion system protein [Planctomycetaceae bacterium]|nr:type IV secretion system protein [Planctomycetaceae bacterium]